MKTIYADFNALTPDEHVSLGTRGSSEDMERLGVRVGDRVWLSDGELLVGSSIVVDPVYGIVGVPDWDSLVHLDGEDDPERRPTGSCPDPDDRGDAVPGPLGRNA